MLILFNRKISVPYGVKFLSHLSYWALRIFLYESKGYRNYLIYDFIELSRVPIRCGNINYTSFKHYK